ncbi:Mechanosensitive channel MscK precursor [Polystyrenella longa]|uniref:Mechanosensitive channel MscK n=1 Tax=Polystyrenella longa TaxID=2528007 RepID=A0A518CK47_9PLAN|nr:mechanosensitive ion channel domain-containing protein [Polystyrenella longa]QDU79554.1 Mechanosensitive channel MscK precursor [Polystyrenella longa]
MTSDIHFSRLITWRSFSFLVLGLTLGLVQPTILHAQPAPESVGEKAETATKQTPSDVLAEVDELVSQVTANPDADDATKTKAEELKKEIQRSLDVWRQKWELTGITQQDIKTTPTEAQKMKAETEQLRNEPPKQWNPSTPATELEQELEALKTKLQALQEESTKLATQAEKRNTRRQEIQEQLDKLTAEEATVTTTLQASQVNESSPPLEKLQQLNNQTMRVRIGQQRKALETELQQLEVQQSVDWTRLKTELTELQLSKVQENVRLLTDEYQKARKREAARAVKEAEQQNQEFVKAYPELQSIVTQNQEWAIKNQELIGSLTKAENSLTANNANLTELDLQYQRVSRLVEQVGHTGPIGIMLRNLKSEMKGDEDYAAGIPKRNETLADVQLKIFQLEEQKSTIVQPDLFVQNYLPNEDAEKQQIAIDAIRKQRETLKTLSHNYNQFYDTLYKLNVIDKKLIAKQQEFTSYINERVLWIRSSPILSLQELKADDKSFHWLFSLDGWQQVWTQSLNRVRQAPLQSVSIILLWSLLLILGARWRRQLAEISKQVTPNAFYKFYPTVKATILSLLIAIVWPLFFWGWAWQLDQQSYQESFPQTLIPALNLVGNWFFAIEFIRLLFRSKGLADSHFQWNFSSMLTVRRNIRWLMMLSVPLVFLGGLLQGNEIDEAHDAWERVAYILFQCCLTIFLFNIFRPSSGLFQTIVDYKQNAWMDRLRGLTCLLLVSIPVTLIAFSFLGFHYTAFQLNSVLGTTAWFLIALFVVRALAHRWIMLGYRRLSILRSQQKREQQKEAEKQAQENTEPGAMAEAPIKLEEERPIDLRFSSHQIRRLLNATLWTVAFLGVWLIWHDMMPALSALDSSERFAVWHTTNQVTDPETNNTIDVIEPVTIFDLALGLAVALLTVAATRNIPGLLEMTILEQLPIDASVRYAVTTIARYVCILLGGIVGFQVVGVAWSQVQWMATALTFGLAFGLQEIFANFISGIILLFERPIRVGDIVTIDSVSGIVSRIRMRATTITDWDRKEYVVPNKEFITGRLLNWTLSDPVNRIVIEVGVAYGSDLEKATGILKRLAVDHPEILEDPPPVVTFDRFGDSTLNLIMRAYLPSLENRLMTIHQLHMQINSEFNAAGIEIAFPQRDLHIRSMPPGFGQQASDNSKSHEGNGNGHNPKPPTEPQEAFANTAADPGVDD